MSMIFADALKNELNSEKTMTENGAVGYKTSKSALVDFNFKMSSYRNCDEGEIENDFADAWNENPVLAVKMAFFAGDIRGGMGERRVFRTCMNWLASHHKGIAKKVVGLIPEYSRWDILIDLLGTKVDKEVFDIVKNQYQTDMAHCIAKKEVSLLAKWMPSVNTSSQESRRAARSLCSRLGLTERTYRKNLSMLRKFLNVVETKMSSNKWDEIDYNGVPSKANILYKEAFMRHDTDRRTSYLEALENHEEGVKINSGAVFPYDIVHRYAMNMSNFKKDVALEQMWKALPDYINGNGSNTICIVDGSGSMCSSVGNTGVSCHDVARSLAIYFSERMSGQFKDKYITFSRNPALVDLSKCASLNEKIYECTRHDECQNTDIEKAFKLILNAAVNNHLKQEDIPENVLILSDMEFDAHSIEVGCNDWFATTDEFDSRCKTLFENIDGMFRKNGYKMPRLVFWNICSRTNAVPIQENENGVALVSGFSPAIASMVFSQKNNPYEVLVEKLNSERYDAVEKALK